MDQRGALAEQLVLYLVPTYTTAVCLLLLGRVLLSQHDSLDSPGTLGIRGRTVRLESKELRAQRRRVLMGDVMLGWLDVNFAFKECRCCITGTYQ